MNGNSTGQAGDLQREQALFVAALERPMEDRTAFLDGACHGDPSLRQRLEALLSAHEQPATELGDAGESTVKAEEGTHELDEAIGQTLGRYKLLERVGEGGCGVVYVAEQTEPVRRRVALKVIKLGMDTKQVVARFEAERQALAMMDHPNIAKVLDAGTTEQGRPYFVMELVRGIKITNYCDQERVPTRERLDLFIKVCHAIQHAHQKGIIHRDIKPSNILVTLHDGVPVPKVIDFGIAKATEGRLTDNTVYTQLHQFIGTPAYMSPEQAEMSGLDIDTRSDIYSLGVLLYELLTGRTPFDGRELMSMGIDVMRRTIREKEPLRPSTRLTMELSRMGSARVPRAESGVAPDVRSTPVRRHGESQSEGGFGGTPQPAHGTRALPQHMRLLINTLRGDLDWVVMKCLEKNRTRRYDTANGLAADLRRHLKNEPVVARPPSAAYKLQKAWRRNKIVSTAAASVAVALILGLGTAIVMFVRESEAYRRARAAEREQTKLREVAVKALDGEKEQRETVEARELEVRYRAYASDMNVAQQALDDHNLGRALELLDRQRPQPGQRDLRGWEWRYLWGQTRSDAEFTLCTLTNEVKALEVSPDGNWLAVGTLHKGPLTVWDLRKRKAAFRLKEEEWTTYAAFSPTGPLLAFTGMPVVGKKYDQHLWNTATREMVAERSLKTMCQGLAFSQDGRTLVTSCEGEPIVLWRMPECTQIAEYGSDQFGNPNLTSFAITPDLRLAAYCLKHGEMLEIQVVDLRNGNELWKTKTNNSVTAPAFSPDGKTLAAAKNASARFDIGLWDVATGKETGRLTGHVATVTSIVFWPDGSKLASASDDQTIRVWDLDSRQSLDVLRGHRDEVLRLTLLPNSPTLVSGSRDGEVCLWDTSRLHPRQARITLPVYTNLWSFTPNGGAVVTVDKQGRAARWSGVDFQNMKPLTDVAPLAATNVVAVRLSSDASRLALASVDGTVRVWDASTGRPARQFEEEEGPVRIFGFFAGGSRLLTWTEDDEMLHIWNLAPKPVAEVQSWRGPASFHFGDAAISPDNRFCMAVGGEVSTVERNLESQESTFPQLRLLETADCDFSPDGRFFVIGSGLGYARVWDTATWQEVATLRGFQEAAKLVAFSPNGRRLATRDSGANAALKLWDAASWQQVLSLKSVGFPTSTAFSPDGNTLASSGDGLNIWRAPSWAEIHAAEAQDPPSAEYGATCKMEDEQP